MHSSVEYMENIVLQIRTIFRTSIKVLIIVFMVYDRMSVQCLMETHIHHSETPEKNWNVWKADHFQQISDFLFEIVTLWFCVCQNVNMVPHFHDRPCSRFKDLLCCFRVWEDTVMMFQIGACRLQVQQVLLHYDYVQFLLSDVWREAWRVVGPSAVFIVVVRGHVLCAVLNWAQNPGIFSLSAGLESFPHRFFTLKLMTWTWTIKLQICGPSLQRGSEFRQAWARHKHGSDQVTRVLRSVSHERPIATTSVEWKATVYTWWASSYVFVSNFDVRFMKVGRVMMGFHTFSHPSWS